MKKMTGMEFMLAGGILLASAIIIALVSEITRTSEVLSYATHNCDEDAGCYRNIIGAHLIKIEPEVDKPMEKKCLTFNHKPLSKIDWSWKDNVGGR